MGGGGEARAAHAAVVQTHDALDDRDVGGSRHRGAVQEQRDDPLLADQVRVAVAGGSALPVEVHHEFERRFGVTILEGYGLSETSPVASFSVWGEPVRVGSIGKPIPGVEMKLINPEPGVREDVEDAEDVIGEIAIKGPNIMKGYYGRPDATAEAIVDGWFRSGDLGRKDADGWYYIVDRSKDMIIRGGYNVYPREIEEVLLTHEAVSLVAVVGVPHDSHGEEVKAFVIKKQGAGPRETFTVRKQSFGVGVERTFPLHSPKIDKIEVAAIGDVNRAKLYYLRGRVGKKARVRELRT